LGQAHSKIIGGRERLNKLSLLKKKRGSLV